MSDLATSEARISTAWNRSTPAAGASCSGTFRVNPAREHGERLEHRRLIGTTRAFHTLTNNRPRPTAATVFSVESRYASSRVLV